MKLCTRKKASQLKVIRLFLFVCIYVYVIVLFYVYFAFVFFVVTFLKAHAKKTSHGIFSLASGKLEMKYHNYVSYNSEALVR